MTEFQGVFGYHLTMDGLFNEPPSKAIIEEILTKLPGQIGMSILMGPFIKEGIPENPGITGILVVDFSHIAVHTFTDTRIISIDVYSCKPFSANNVRHYLTSMIDFQKYTVDYIHREVK